MADSMPPITTPQKERGHSLIAGKAPAYKSRKKANNDKALPSFNEEKDPSKLLPTLSPRTPAITNAAPAAPLLVAPDLATSSSAPSLVTETVPLTVSETATETPQLSATNNGLDINALSTTAATKQAAPSKRASIRDNMRKSMVIRDPNNSAPMTEEKMEEDVGNTFKGMWGALGIGQAFTKVKEKVVSAATDVHPSEIMERVTNGFPKRKYVPKHHTLAPVADQELHLKMKEAELREQFGKKGDTSGAAAAATATTTIPSSLDISEKRRRAGMMKNNAAMGAANPFHTLGLTQDELDYFWGAFCEAADCLDESTEAPTQITLEQLVAWFYKVPYRFKQKKLDKDNLVLNQVIRFVHHYDEGVTTITADEDDIQKKPDFDKQLLQKKREEAASFAPGAKSNVSISANDIKEVAVEETEKLTFDEERIRLIGLGTGAQLHLTFIDFVLGMWNYLSADHDMLMKILWELVEIGQYGGEGTNAVSPEAVKDIIEIFQPFQVFETSKRCQQMYTALKDTALVKDHKNGRTEKNPTGKETLIFLGNFVQLCKKAKSFSSIVVRLQLDIQQVLIGSNFWKRQQTFRRTKFGMSNLHFVLQDEFLDEASVMALTQEDMLNMIGDEEEEEEEVVVEAEAEKAGAEFMEKKATRRIGQTILLLDKKRTNGEKLTSEENWLLQKATVQQKAANMMYMRQSKAVLSSNTKEHYGEGLKRGVLEEEESGEEEEEEEDEEEDEAK